MRCGKFIICSSLTIFFPIRIKILNLSLSLQRYFKLLIYIRVMRAKKFACCLMVMSLLAGISFISCGNSSRAKVESEAAQTGEDFKSFLDKFTSSAAFQYTRVKFPLKTPGYFIGG